MLDGMIKMAYHIEYINAVDLLFEATKCNKTSFLRGETSKMCLSPFRFSSILKDCGVDMI
jgi:hypothetical protein